MATNPIAPAGHAPPPPARPQPQGVIMAVVDGDPANSKSAFAILSSLDATTTAEYQQMLAHFGTCGVCCIQPARVIQFSAFWSSVSGDRLAAGFVSCGSAACNAVCRLRAEERRTSLLLMKTQGIHSMPETVAKACSYCARNRELLATKLCSRCRAVRYCSVDCQRAHWPFHKGLCHPSSTNNQD